VLASCAAALGGGEAVAPLISDGLARLQAAGFDPIDYLSVCDAETLRPIAWVEGPARVLAAAHLGSTRLIDNVGVERIVGAGATP
jgi:pantoate--beta-alanine ligase